MVRLALLLLAGLIGCFGAIYLTEHSFQVVYGDSGILIDLHNEHRASVGVPAVVRASDLDSFAQDHAKRMAQSRKLSHSNLDFPGRYRSENIGLTTHSDENSVMKMWLNSLNHRNNIERIIHSHIGVGKSRARDGRYYWAVVFRGN